MYGSLCLLHLGELLSVFGVSVFGLPVPPVCPPAAGLAATSLGAKGAALSKKLLGSSLGFRCCDQFEGLCPLFHFALKALTKKVRSSPSGNILLSQVLNVRVNHLEDFLLLSFEIWDDTFPSTLTVSHRAE